jgi:NAD(P)-dependent dehydrogenase (short-subunit alcohol dehydrogenase family)
MAEQARTALITGAAEGIGWAMARRFAASDGRVVIADPRKEAAEARAAEPGEGHGAAFADVWRGQGRNRRHD